MIPLYPPHIWRKSKEIPNLLGKKGSVISFSRIHTPPPNTITCHLPYYIALIRLKNSSKKLFVEVCRENDKKIQTGRHVQLVLRKQAVTENGLIKYGLKAKVIT